MSECLLFFSIGTEGTVEVVMGTDPLGDKCRPQDICIECDTNIKEAIEQWKTLLQRRGREWEREWERERVKERFRTHSSTLHYITHYKCNKESNKSPKSQLKSRTVAKTYWRGAGKPLFRAFRPPQEPRGEWRSCERGSSGTLGWLTAMPVTSSALSTCCACLRVISSLSSIDSSWRSSNKLIFSGTSLLHTHS